MLRFERRAAGGDVLSEAFLKAGDPLCFDDLVQVVPGGDVRAVARWLGHAVQEGLVEEVPSYNGAERCYRLRARGRRVLTLQRRGRVSRPAHA